ncbi:MAG: VCBS repeat-containing protein [Bacteroidetes bacterium]|nr:VCBS repeat-containing protein [Bacteroidota bacterium]
MKKTLRIATMAMLLCSMNALQQQAAAQPTFTNANSRLTNSNFRSGCAVTVVDVNNDGLDDIVRMNQGHVINLELQDREGNFENHLIDDISAGGNSSWAMTMADVDHNGWKDVVADGDGGIRLVKIFESGGVITSTNTILANSGFFLQNATFCDMNNDGWIDLFCCDDNDASKLYLNDGTGNLDPSTMVNFAVNPTVFYGGDPADSGNYGSAWIDFDNDHDLDLYVAHCRQSTSSPTDLRRINRLFVNDGSNNFTEQAGAFGIDVGWQTWTSSFGDIDNDGDLDLMLTNHDHTSQIFENDGTGHYTELTTTGFNTNSITPIESVFEDFDNDGFIDILVTGDEWVYHRNNGDKTFTRITTMFANNGMLSFSTGDLNHDGFIDIYASYGNIYQSPSNTYDDVLYLNNKNSNNFITFNVEGTTSNKGAIGARATIYGPWGIQIREVRAGESYGTCNSFQLHFGLGQEMMVDSAVVWFPSGNTTTFTNLNANQFVTVVEGGCTVAGNIIPGPYIICTGQTLTLNAPAGYTSYLWNDGSTGASLTVSAAGSYNVMVTDASGCSNISASIELLVSPDETPTVASTGDLVFCEGGSTMLTSTPAASYLWSDGSTTQSITPSTSGCYTVTIQGVCNTFTSAPVCITVLDAPEPVTTGAAGPPLSTLLLTATGDSLSWYDQQQGGTLLTNGSSYTTPPLATTTTYWVDNTLSYPGDVEFTGQTYHSGTAYSGSGNTNSNVEFDVLGNATLVSVKVYTDTPGDREIQLKNSAGTVLNSLLVNIPIDSSRVTLNFPLVPGTNYELTTNPIVNNSSFGFNGPRLRRSSTGVTYPYQVANVISLTGSNQGGSFYYYFYDWEVQEPSYVCVSDRVPVVADITTGIGAINTNDGILVYPNPASYEVTVEFAEATVATVELTDLSGRVIKTQNIALSTPGTAKLDLTGIAKGSYQLRILSDKSESVKRITVK